MNRGEERKNLFKKQDFDNGRRRREETTTQLRKTKKEEQLMKRRQAAQPASTDDLDEKAKVFSAKDIPDLMAVLCRQNNTDSELLDAIKGFRRMLSVEVNPPVNEVLAAGAMPYLVQYLEKMDNPTIIFEAAWALTNIASTDRTRDVVNAGAAIPLIRLLKHTQGNLREQAAWCIGNIAGDCVELRDMILREGALDGLLLNVNEPESMALLGNVTWAVSNLVRGKPSPDCELIVAAIAPLASLLARQVSPEVMVDAVWALSYLADGDDDRIQMVMETGVAKSLVGLIPQNHKNLMTPVIRTLGNFVTGTDEQTQAIVDAGIVQCISESGLLEDPNKSLRKETCWLLSNIAAGTQQQIDELFKQDGLVEKVIDMACDERWEIRREAIWVIANIFTTGNDFQLRRLVQKNGFQAISKALEVSDVKIVSVAMEAIEKILGVGQKLNLNFNHVFDEYGGVDKLEELQQHPSEKVYEKSVDLLEKFFGVEEEEDENIAPAQSDGMFGFGMHPSKQLFPDECLSPTGGNAPVLSQSNFDFSMQH